MNSTVAKLEWLEEYNLFKSEIDDQHKKIFTLVNEIIDTERLYPKSEKFAIILSQLTDYGKEHFKIEEDIMIKCNFPGYEQHRKEHQDYILKVAMFNFNFNSANFTEPDIVLDFVSKWWYHHILYNDLHLAQFLHGSDLK
jgi:hemerythrin